MPAPAHSASVALPALHVRPRLHRPWAVCGAAVGGIGALAAWSAVAIVGVTAQVQGWDFGDWAFTIDTRALVLGGGAAALSAVAFGAWVGALRARATLPSRRLVDALGYSLVAALTTSVLAFGAFVRPDAAETVWVAARVICVAAVMFCVALGTVTLPVFLVFVTVRPIIRAVGSFISAPAPGSPHPGVSSASQPRR